MVSPEAIKQIEEVKKTLKETEETLESIGPSHVLYKDLKDELEQLKKNLAIIEKIAQL
jgi:hypothetical protein